MHLAADGGHAEAVAVVRDAATTPSRMRRLRAPVVRIVEAAEAQRIQHGDGARAHGEDVAQNAADAGGRALERLDEAGVVVRFDLEGDDVAAADIDDAGVLAGALHHEFAARGQLLQMNAGALVGAVLAPHHAEDAEFGVAGLAAENVDDLLVFAGSQLVLGDDFRGEGGVRSCAPPPRPAASIAKTTRPSVRAHQRLGGALGMRHHAHHVALAIEDAGDVAQRAVGIIDVAEGHAVLGFEFVQRALVGDVAAFAVRDRQAQHLALCVRAR